MSAYDRYETLRFERSHPGVLEIVLDNPPVNSVGIDGHRHITEVWLDIARDESVRSVLLRAEGRAFSAGGDYDLLDHIMESQENVVRVMKEAGDIVRNIIETPQPIVAAVNGVAVGAGLAAALMADIPIAGRSARFLDGHVGIGVAAGDHAVVLWPLLIGMAKAKYHLLANESIDGTEAERIGLVSKVVEDDELLDEARRVAVSLAEGSRTAIQWTKRSLNHWLRSAIPAFDASLAQEFLGWLGPDAREGVDAVREKRKPDFS